jgi:DNA (cytosine-5)-methyltransferase 1
LQFRPSGIRIKKTNYTPALTRNSTQIPIIGWEQRYLTLVEAARLQGLDGIKLPLAPNQAFRALGNAVNVQLVTLIAKELFKDCLKENRSNHINGVELPETSKRAAII